MLRRFGAISAAFILVVILVVAEIIIIKSASNYEPQSEIVFARVRIPDGTEITADMLEVKKIGTSLVHRLSMKKIQDIAGKRAGTDIEAGEMLLSAKLDYGGMESIKVRDKNKRLYSVEFKGDQANGWRMVADQYVDVIFVPDKKEQNYGGLQKLSNIRIAALIDENGKIVENKDRAALPKYVSFEVTDEQVDFLAYAKSNGRLELCVIPE